MANEPPICKTPGGRCPIPKVISEAQRLNQIRNLLINLKDRVDAGTICRICQVESDELLMLAEIEAELDKALKTLSSDPNNGDQA
jgi:hypothetical protein